MQCLYLEILLTVFGATCLMYDGPLLGLRFWLSVGVKVWYGGEEFPIDFLPLFMFYTLTKFCLLFFLSN